MLCNVGFTPIVRKKHICTFVYFRSSFFLQRMCQLLSAVVPESTFYPCVWLLPQGVREAKGVWWVESQRIAAVIERAPTAGILSQPLQQLQHMQEPLIFSRREERLMLSDTVLRWSIRLEACLCECVNAFIQRHWGGTSGGEVSGGTRGKCIPRDNT